MALVSRPVMRHSLAGNVARSTVQDTGDSRHVLYVTGTRADYGLMTGVLRAIASHPKLRLSVLVTGMHLSQEFGETIKEVEKDGFQISHRLEILPEEDEVLSMAKAVGTAIVKMADAFQASQPQFVLLEGDRGESLAAAIAAAHMNIAVAHVSGGDVTGTVIDEGIRHSITKFAHIHFPGTRLSERRLLSMGEDPWRVHMLGTPGCDLTAELALSSNEVAEHLGIDPARRVLVVLQHPVTTEADDAPRQMRETMEAVVALKEQAIVIYPNADSGGREMIRVVKEYERVPCIHSYKSLPRATYVGLLSIATALIGNSSSGVVEAPDFGLPAVNVGTRQQGRERGGNLLDVGYCREEIELAVKYIMAHQEDPDLRQKWGQSPYRDTGTAARIAEVLGKVELGPKLLQKRFCDDGLGQDVTEREQPAAWTGRLP